MGRKDAARFKKIEDRIEELEKTVKTLDYNHRRFVQAVRNDQVKFRDVLTKIIEGD